MFCFVFRGVPESWEVPALVGRREGGAVSGGSFVWSGWGIELQEGGSIHLQFVCLVPDSLQAWASRGVPGMIPGGGDYICFITKQTNKQ